MYIPANQPMPGNNEYILSLFSRMAWMNAFSRSFTNFMGMFFISDSRRFRYRDALSTEPLYFKMAQELDRDPQMLVKQIEENTLFSGCAPFMSKALQASYIDAYTRQLPEGSSFRDKYRKLANLTEDIRSCPDCIRENINDTGIWWLKTEHQLPGVHVCPQHGTPLHILSSNMAKVNAEKIPESQGEYEVTDFDRDYAGFITKLAGMKLDVCLEDMRKVLDVGDLEFSEGVLANVEDPKKLRNSLKTSGHHEQIPVRDAVIVLMHLYGTPENIPFEIDPDADAEDRKAFEEALEARGYELIGEYHRCRPIVLRHKECGCGHITTAWNFMCGWGCPKCDLEKNDTEIIAALVEAAGKGEYHLVTDEVTSLSKPIEIIHDKCGETSKVTLQAFLKKKYKCKCEQKVGADEFYERMAEINPDIEFTSPYTGYMEKIGCKCMKCGHKWEARPGKLLTGDGCPMYYKHMDFEAASKYSTEDFRKRLAEVRPDLELVSEYYHSLEPVTIRCRVCGETFSAVPDRIRKKKCPNEKNHKER